MLDNAASRLVQSLGDDKQLELFVSRVAKWLSDELSPSDAETNLYGESRAKALLRSADVVDEATLKDFASLMQNESARRVALYDLLVSAGMAEDSEVEALAINSPAGESSPLPWFSLITAAFAWKGGYSLYQLDPASPPDPYSPAGQVLKRASHLVRQQLVRSATERDRLARQLTRPAGASQTLEDLTAPESPAAPLPPHYRPPIPERYPEVASETLHVDPEAPLPETAPSLGTPLVITEEELSGSDDTSTDPVRMPPITITADQVIPPQSSPPSPLPSTGVIIPSSSGQPRPSLTMALRQMFGQEELKSTKLNVIVQKYPDGPGLFGLQVRVFCKGIKSYVAGTTNREGRFACELPVRVNSGLTYDVEITWPRDEGGEVERKSITLNADRTQFTLPFHRQVHPPAGEQS
jgi:hypothetical protein